MPKHHHKRANRNPKSSTTNTVTTEKQKMDKTIPKELQETIILSATKDVSTLNNNMVDDISISTEKSNHSHHSENIVSNDVNESLISNESSWRDVDHTPIKSVNYDNDRQENYKYDYNRSMTAEKNNIEIDENETGICHISQPSIIHLSSSCDTLLTNLAIETPYTNNERKAAYFNDEDDDNFGNDDYRRLENVDGSNNSSWKRLTMDNDVILQDISLSSLVPSSPLSETETSNEQQDQDDFDDANKVKTSKGIKKIFLFTKNEVNLGRSANNKSKWSFIYYFKLLIHHMLRIASESIIVQKCQKIIQSVAAWYILTVIWCIQLPYRILRYMILSPYTLTLWCFKLLLDILNHLTAPLLGNWKQKSTSTSQTYGGVSTSATAATISSTTSTSSGSNYRHTVIMSNRVTTQ